jgi:hypothetical protein
MRTPRQIIGAQAVMFVLAGCGLSREVGGEPSAEGQGPDVQGEGEQGVDEETADEQASGESSGESSEGEGEPGEGEQSEGEPGEDETETTSAETGTESCDDSWEPNPSADQASRIMWQSADEWTAQQHIDDASLCSGEDDWYHFDVQSLGYVEHYLYVRALIKDAGLCGLNCDEPVIPAGPQHAMTIEIYRADDVELLASLTDDDGVLVINGPGGDAYADDLLIHVFSPTPTAEYPYRLSVAIRNYDGEDECEC